MSTAEQYRAKATEYSELLKLTSGADNVREFQRLEQSFIGLADNAQWMNDNRDKVVHATDGEASERVADRSMLLLPAGHNVDAEGEGQDG